MRCVKVGVRSIVSGYEYPQIDKLGGDAEMTTSTSDRVDIRPQPKQEAFLASPADIAIFGGGAGGG